MRDMIGQKTIIFYVILSRGVLQQQRLKIRHSCFQRHFVIISHCGSHSHLLQQNSNKPALTVLNLMCKYQLSLNFKYMRN